MKFVLLQCCRSQSYEFFDVLRKFKYHTVFSLKKKHSLSSRCRDSDLCSKSKQRDCLQMTFDFDIDFDFDKQIYKLRDG